MKSLPIPLDVWKKFQAYCEQGKTGSLHLDIKEGKVVAWNLAETGRVRGDAVYLHE